MDRTDATLFWPVPLWLLGLWHSNQWYWASLVARSQAAGLFKVIGCHSAAATCTIKNNDAVSPSHQRPSNQQCNAAVRMECMVWWSCYTVSYGCLRNCPIFASPSWLLGLWHNNQWCRGSAASVLTNKKAMHHWLLGYWRQGHRASSVVIVQMATCIIKTNDAV